MAGVTAVAEDLAAVDTVARRNGDAATDEMRVQPKLSLGMLDKHVIADAAAGREVTETPAEERLATRSSTATTVPPAAAQIAWP